MHMMGIAHVERSVEISGRQQRTVTRFYSADGNVTATMSVTKPCKKKSAFQKKPPYSYKQLSSQLMRARNSGAVAQILIKMRNKRAQLSSAKRSGEYDEAEVALAIIHAEEIEQVARKRKKNLEMEEKAELIQEREEYEEELEEAADPLGLFGGEKGKNRVLSEEEMKRILSDLEEEMNTLIKEMEENAQMDESLDEMTEALSGNVSPEDLEEMKKKHRAAEQRDILKADLKYLKALFDKLARDKEQVSSASGSDSADFLSSMAPTAPGLPFIAESPGAAASAATPSPEGQMIDVSV